MIEEMIELVESSKPKVTLEVDEKTFIKMRNHKDDTGKYLMTETLRYLGVPVRAVGGTEEFIQIRHKFSDGSFHLAVLKRLL